MRLGAVAILVLATAACAPAGAGAGPGGDEARTASQTTLAAGEWEIVTTTVPPPGAPMPPQIETATLRLDVAEAAIPPARLFGACESGSVELARGIVRGDMPCRGDGALSNATVTVNGRYDRTSFDVTVDTRFMGMTLRQEKRGRHLRS